MPKLTNDEIEVKLKGLSGWVRKEEEIQKCFTHKNFVEAIAFINKIADLAEKAHHHPDILINWNKVTLTLSTHSEEGLTDKDFSLAAEIDRA